MPSIAAVTVNWNRPQDTLACLRSLRQQQDVDVRLVVVDNGSSDDSLNLIHQEFPAADLIETGINVGFARGFNTGIQRALETGADYVFIVNNDTVADPAMLKHLVDDVTPSPSIAGPVIYRADLPDRIWSSGGYFVPLSLEIDGHHTERDGVPASPKERDFLSGCALLIHRDVFKRIGLFDERFFMYYEDIDFCLRAHRHGLKMWIVPAAKLWHAGSTSSGGGGSPNERFYMAMSGGLYYRKHMRGVQKLVVPPLRLMSAALWTMRLAFRRSWPAIRAYWRGLIRGWFAA